MLTAGLSLSVKSPKLTMKGRSHMTSSPGGGKRISLGGRETTRLPAIPGLAHLKRALTAPYRFWLAASLPIPQPFRLLSDQAKVAQLEARLPSSRSHSSRRRQPTHHRRYRSAIAHHVYVPLEMCSQLQIPIRWISVLVI